MQDKSENKSENKSGVKQEKENKAEKKKFFKKILYLLSAVLVLAGLAAAWLYFTSFESTDDAFIEANIIRISPKVSGTIEKLYIDDNRHVNEGDLLMEIDPRDYQVRYDQTKSAYEMSLYRQKSAVADESAAKVDMELSKDDYDRYIKLYKKGAVSKQELDRAKSRYETSRSRHTLAKESVFSRSKTRVADAELKKLEAAMRQAKLELSYTKIYAPVSGKITNRVAEVGAFTHAGSPLFSIVPDKRWVVANFKETQVGRMKAGQTVKIKVDAYSHKIFMGKVDSIQSSTGAKTSLFPPENAVGSYVKVVQRVPVKIVFTEKIPANYNIEPGMSVIPKVIIK